MTMKTEDLIKERGKTHGDWSRQASTAYGLKKVMRASQNWDGLDQMQTEALDMIVTKISRILTGNASEPDHWDDIAGYAKLGKGGHNAEE